MKGLNHILTALGIGVLVLGCEPGVEDQEFAPEIILSDSITTQFNHELGTVRRNIEQSASMYNRLNELNCPYNQDLTLGREEVYDVTMHKALAFGGHAASFVYSASYFQTQEAAKTLDYIVRLSEELGIRESFDEKEIRELLSEDVDVDKSAILTRAYLKATEQLYTEERAVLVSFMVVGGWVEGMKLSYETCSDYLTDDNVRLGIYDQSYSYYNCKRILETFDHVEEAGALLEKLAVLEPEIQQVVRSRGNIDTNLVNKVRLGLDQLQQEILK